MKQLAETLNQFAPALTLLVLVGGLVWTTATRNAQFEAVREDLQELTTNVEALQADVRSVQETLPHMVTCMFDLHGIGRADDGSLVNRRSSEDYPVAMPFSCEQARLRTTPSQGN